MAKHFRWDSAPFAPRPNTVIPSTPAAAPSNRQFEPHEQGIRLGRWAKDRFVAEACRLRRVSQSGALVLLSSALSEGEPVWVSLHGQAERFGSVPARVSKVVLVAPGAVLAWLKFGVPCPAEFLYGAVFGADVLEASLN